MLSKSHSRPGCSVEFVVGFLLRECLVLNVNHRLFLAGGVTFDVDHGFSCQRPSTSCQSCLPCVVSLLVPSNDLVVLLLVL